MYAVIMGRCDIDGLINSAIWLIDDGLTDWLCAYVCGHGQLKVALRTDGWEPDK